ncbi:hypothetical protein BgiBS90_015287 [Biomphalaria glabrata]|uniref:NTR domain-containing protein n=1 Tax=Biomphalaria glabrata TaxID=6526 RepID=A0A2C9LM09_BIOGL|nr:hypothetical protein BgiBS90_015287 [Biomphalaria glabrata]
MIATHCNWQTQRKLILQMNLFSKQTKMFVWYKLLCLVAVTMSTLACDDVKRNVSQSEFCNVDVVYKAKILSNDRPTTTDTREVTFKLLDQEEYIRFSSEAEDHWHKKSISIVRIPYVKELKCDSKFTSSDENHYLVLAHLIYQDAKWSDKLSVPNCTSLIPLNCIEGNLPHRSVCKQPERTES